MSGENPVSETIEEAAEEAEEKQDAEDTEKVDNEEGEEGREDSEVTEEKSNRADEKLTEDVEALKDALAKIKVTAPTIEIYISDEFNQDDFPGSYKDNSTKEQLVLAYAENFRRQYVHLYRDRKPLFLNPVNESGIEKFLCTTIRTTQLPYEELYDWDGAAEFVADYLNFAPLEPPTELPNHLWSPMTILRRQKGNSFEYSTILCSLLIGAGYDAYVVSGYASKEVCLMDETREICPLLKKKEEEKQEEKKKQRKKYEIKPPKDLRSKFELKQERRKQEALDDEERKRKKEDEEKQAELEKPPPDPLHGLRVHSWVLVLAGKREVPENFFIEPFTGIAHPTSSESYLGIESVWNYQNYWVNMQDCSEGVKKMKYDLGDCTLWEFMFPSNDKPQLQIPEDQDEFLESLDDDEQEDDVERHLDMPPSWIEPIHISLKDFQMRCPHGKKSKLYKRAKLEKFAHYLERDGLVTRLSSYSDKELLDLMSVREYYEHRLDKLYQKVHNLRTGWITEYYTAGRPRCLKEHQFKASSPGPENDRVMVFYDEARVDGLRQREETPIEMTETFVDRADFLYYRHVSFGKRPRKFGPAEDTITRPILKMVEMYHHNKKKPANEDIAELIYLISEEKIQLTYHTEDAKISACTREFIKPSNADEKGVAFTMTQDMHITFQVDPNSKQKKQVEIYQLMMNLLDSEEKCRERVRGSEAEVQEILNDRMKEEVASELDISVYDTERNEKAKKHRKDVERIEMEEKMRRQEMELDYLAPFLAQIGDPEKITRQQAYKLKEDCLSDLKQRLIDKANLIQARFEKETQELQKKQSWYQQNQVSMQKDDEEEYLNYCSDAMFRIHILELRLNKHKEMAPHKYMALEQRIRADQRLSEYF